MLDMLPEVRPFEVTPLVWHPRPPIDDQPTPESIDILRYARKLINSTGRWTQHSVARTIFGHPTTPDSSWAFSYCARGAVWRARKNLGYEVEHSTRAMQLLGGEDLIVSLNDAQGRDAVLGRFDAVLARYG